MLTVLVLATMMTAVAPQNEEVGVPPQTPQSIGVIVGAALGAVVVGVGLSTTSFYVITEQCSQQLCRDNPAFLVAAQMGILGTLVGAVFGGTFGFLIVNAMTPFDDEIPDQ